MTPAYITDSLQWFDVDKATKWTYNYVDGSYDTVYRTRKGGYFRKHTSSMKCGKGKDDSAVFGVEPFSKEEALRWFMVAGIELPPDLLSASEEQEV